MSVLRIEPLAGAPFGAKIVGLDPTAIGSAEAEQIWHAYRQRHGLLCFAFDRLLELPELHALTAFFGQKEFAPGMINGIGRMASDGDSRTVEEQVAALEAEGTDPYLTHLGNVDARTSERRPTDKSFFGEWEWHTDMSYIEVPPTFSLLHARQIPESGGDTGFCDQVMAAAELPPALRRKIEGLEIKHDSTYGSSGKLRPGMTPPASPIEAIGHSHPVLRRVPSTEDEALFLGRRTNAYVVGLPLDESEELLDELWAHATDPRFCFHHHWTVGEVVVWDNRMLLHQRKPFDENEIRHMWRTQTKGEAVISG